MAALVIGVEMRFLITMSMPSYNNNLVHQMQVEHSDSSSLDDFVNALTTNDFVVVEEFYKDPYRDGYQSRGMVAVNYRYVGKIKVFNFENGNHGSQRRDRESAEFINAKR